MYIDSNNIFQQIGLTENKNQITFEQQKPILAVIEIELGDNQTIPLQIRQSDNPYTLAVNFCKQHNLNQMAVSIIQRRVEQALNNSFDGTKNIASSSRLNPKHMSPIKKSHQNSTTFPSKSPVKNNKSKLNSEDIGKKLYEKGLKSNQRNQQFRFRQKLEKQKQQEKHLTFKPKLNLVSEKIVQVRKMYGQDKSRKKSPRKNQVMIQQMEQCTFKPKLNKVSEKIVKSQTRQEQDRIEELYYDSVRMAQKKKNMNQKPEFSYHPTINQRSRETITETFMERLEKTVNNLKRNQIKRKYENYPECSFVPQIGRPPKVERNKQNLPIGDYLQNCNRSKSNLRGSDYNNNQNELSHKNKNSEIIYQNLINQRINNLFKILDSDYDGLISAQHINIQSLTSNTLVFMKPLFEELEEIEAVLDDRLFKKAMCKLLESADLASRSRFLTEKWEKHLEQNFSFTPEINNKSRKIITEHQRSKGDLYEQGLQNKKKLQQKIKRAKAQNQQKIYSQCSFKPLLNSSSQIYIRKTLLNKSKKTSNKNDDSLQMQ